MRSGGSYARITTAAEDAKAIIGRGRPKEKVMRSIVPSSATWTEVNKKCGGGESIGPELRRYVGMKEESARAVVECAKNSFSPAVLL